MDAQTAGQGAVRVALACGLALALALGASARGETTRDGTVSFTLPSGVAVRLTESTVRAGQHCAGADAACEVLARTIVGNGGVRPVRVLSEAVVTYRGVSYRLDTSGMVVPLLDKDAKQARARFGGYCYDARNCWFRGVFGDGGSMYAAEWAVMDGHPVRTMLTASSDLAQYIAEHIEPPEYH